MNGGKKCHCLLNQGVLLLCLLGTIPGCAQTPSEDTATDAYRFPVQPGSEEWRGLTSRAEMLAVVQIPEEQLADMSTPGLVDTVLSYPLYGDIFAYMQLQTGFNALKQDFNGLATLLTQPDAGPLLLQKYQHADAAAVDTKEALIQRGQYSAQLTYLEVMLAQPEIVSHLSSEDRTTLLKTTLAQKTAKEDRFEIYGISGIESTAFLAGRILQAENALAEPGEKVDRFLKDGFYENDADLEMIIEVIFGRASSYLKQR